MMKWATRLLVYSSRFERYVLIDEVHYINFVFDELGVGHMKYS